MRSSDNLALKSIQISNATKGDMIDIAEVRRRLKLNSAKFHLLRSFDEALSKQIGIEYISTAFSLLYHLPKYKCDALTELSMLLAQPKSERHTPRLNRLFTRVLGTITDIATLNPLMEFFTIHSVKPKVNSR